MKRRDKNNKIPDIAYTGGYDSFSHIPNDMLRSPDLSAKAKGILCLLLSNKENHWCSYLKTIQKMMADGRDSIRSGLEELEKRNYLLRVKYRDKETKRLKGTIWCYTGDAGVFDFTNLKKVLDKNNIEPIEKLPVTGKATNGNPYIGKSYIGKSYIGKPPPNNTISNNTNNKKNIYVGDGNQQQQEKTNLELENVDHPISSEDDTPARKSNKEKNIEFIPLANRLADIVKSNRNIKIDKSRINSWANEIRKLSTTDGVNPRRIGDALDWYQDNIGGSYIPIIYSGAAFRNKFLALEDAMNRAGIVTHKPIAAKPTVSPQKLLRQQFPNDILRKAFYRECCVPAKQLLGTHEPVEMVDVVKSLIGMYNQIHQIQKKNLSAELRKSLPTSSGPLSLISNYIEWINDQHWIENLQLKMFNTGDGRFSKFRRHQAGEDHLERDPLTGRSYLRE